MFSNGGNNLNNFGGNFGDNFPNNQGGSMNLNNSVNGGLNYNNNDVNLMNNSINMGNNLNQRRSRNLEVKLDFHELKDVNKSHIESLISKSIDKTTGKVKISPETYRHIIESDLILPCASEPKNRIIPADSHIQRRHS